MKVSPVMYIRHYVMSRVCVLIKTSEVNKRLTKDDRISTKIQRVKNDMVLRK